MALCLPGYGWPFCARLWKWLLFSGRPSTLVTQKSAVSRLCVPGTACLLRSAQIRQWKRSCEPKTCPPTPTPRVRISPSLYRINLISGNLNPSLKTTICLLNIPLILFRNDSPADTSLKKKKKVREFNTLHPLPQRIRLKTPFPCIYFHSSWAKIPWFAERETCWNGRARCRRSPLAQCEIKVHTCSPICPLCSVSYFKDDINTTKTRRPEGLENS